MSVFQLLMAFRLKCKVKSAGTSLVVSSLDHLKNVCVTRGYQATSKSNDHQNNFVSRVTLLTAPFFPLQV